MKLLQIVKSNSFHVLPVLSAIAFVLSFSNPLAAQEAQITAKWSLTLDECLLETYNNNPDLNAARESIKSALADKRGAISAYLPQVSVNMDNTVAKTPHVKHTYDTDYELSGSQLIFDSFKTPANILSQSQLLEAARQFYAAASADILLELRSNFVELLRTQRLIQITEEIAERRQINVNLVDLRYQGGRENRGALLRAQANLAQAKFEIEQAKRGLRVNQRRLNQTLGRREFTPLVAQGNFDIKPIEDEIKPDELAAKHPGLLQAAASRKSERWTVVSKWAEFFPTLDLSVSQQLSAPDRWRAVNGHSWSILATVRQPLFEGGEKVFALSKAKADYEKAIDDEQGAFNDVVINIEDQWARAIDAIAQVDVRKLFLDAAMLRAEVSSAQYASGTELFEDWNQIEDELSSARKAYLDAQRDALIAIARWIQRQGLGFEYGFRQS